MGNALTKNEIIKAWECCGKNEREKTAKYCEECPAHNKPYPEGIHGCLDYLTQCSIKCLKEYIAGIPAADVLVPRIVIKPADGSKPITRTEDEDLAKYSEVFTLEIYTKPDKTVGVYLKERQVDGEMAKCENCKHSVPSPQIMKFYCLSRDRNKNTDKEKRVQRTHVVNCPYYTPKESEHSNV